MADCLLQVGPSPEVSHVSTKSVVPWHFPHACRETYVAGRRLIACSGWVALGKLAMFYEVINPDGIPPVGAA